MATTTNFGFNTPDDTDLVKNGALAMRTLGNNIDARFGNVTTYPNQIVNVVSGVSRPVPYAISAGQLNISGTNVVNTGQASATITFATSTRFTQAPVVVVTQTSGPAGSGNLIPKAFSITTTGFTAFLYNASGSTVSWTNAQFSYVAVQMTSASATNSQDFIVIINLICTTEGCVNFEMPIPYPDPAELCICGGCFNEITRKEEVPAPAPKASK